jgi:hypothetical protein
LPEVSAKVEIAETTDSFVNEQVSGWDKISKNLTKKGLRYYWRVESDIPSTKFAKQAAALATTLGIGS